MIELEAMACKSPIICHDLYEILFIDLKDILTVSHKIIDDLKYREKYVDRNYEYIKSVHSTKKVLSHYINIINNNKKH
jgi:hypothetical protein